MARNSLVPKSALIRALVNEAGVTHGQIAVRVGCDRSTISRVVAGQRRIDPQLAKGIAAALGVQTHVIFSRQQEDDHVSVG